MLANFFKQRRLSAAASAPSNHQPQHLSSRRSSTRSNSTTPTTTSTKTTRQTTGTNNNSQLKLHNQVGPISDDHFPSTRQFGAFSLQPTADQSGATMMFEAVEAPQTTATNFSSSSANLPSLSNGSSSGYTTSQTAPGSDESRRRLLMGGGGDGGVSHNAALSAKSRASSRAANYHCNNNDDDDVATDADIEADVDVDIDDCDGRVYVLHSDDVHEDSSSTVRLGERLSAAHSLPQSFDQHHHHHHHNRSGRKHSHSNNQHQILNHHHQYIEHPDQSRTVRRQFVLNPSFVRQHELHHHQQYLFTSPLEHYPNQQSLQHLPAAAHIYGLQPTTTANYLVNNNNNNGFGLGHHHQMDASQIATLAPHQHYTASIKRSPTPVSRRQSRKSKSFVKGAANQTANDNSFDDDDQGLRRAVVNSANVAKKPLGCWAAFVKFLLFSANFSFWVSGFALAVWGILTLIEDNKYNLSQLLVFDPNSKLSLIQLLSWCFITLGCVSILVGFCGYSALFKNNRLILSIYIFFILVIFALDLATGLLAIIFQEKLVANVRLQLANKLRSDYGVYASFTAAVDYIQAKFECCGLEGHFDYDQSLWRLQRLGGFEATVARTCCHLRNANDDQAHINPRPVNESMCQSTDVRFHQSYRFRKGCLNELEASIRRKIWYFIISCTSFDALILVCVLFATCFCRALSSSKSPSSSAITKNNNNKKHPHNKQQQQQQQQQHQHHHYRQHLHSYQQHPTSRPHKSYSSHGK